MGKYINSGQTHGTIGSPRLSFEQMNLYIKSGELYDRMMSKDNEKINSDELSLDNKISLNDQRKHIRGSKNFNPNKSEFYGNVEKAKQLINDFKGKGEKINDSKERIDFGEIIGEYVNFNGERMPTTIGIIHTSNKKGSHIVPARPKAK